jgi:hypothetical protein
MPGQIKTNDTIAGINFEYSPQPTQQENPVTHFQLKYKI